MLRLFIKDNTNGHVHEYGTDKHDSLILQEDGSLHYENMQCCVGTKYPEEGFNFCLEDGTIPEWGLEHGVEPYIDIAGEYYTKPKSNADRIRAMMTISGMLPENVKRATMADDNHPCATCLRWPECNGVDAERCPLINKEGSK